ncbi:MAG TPA: nitroreductase, partial [Lachnospiraceae bacterium]|nr:nitroreductase [Lachnospiraceae bacterium]
GYPSKDAAPSASHNKREDLTQTVYYGAFHK